MIEEDNITLNQKNNKGDNAFVINKASKNLVNYLLKKLTKQKTKLKAQKAVIDNLEQKIKELEG